MSGENYYGSPSPLKIFIFPDTKTKLGFPVVIHGQHSPGSTHAQYKHTLSKSKMADEDDEAFLYGDAEGTL